MTLENVKGKKVIITLTLISLLASVCSFIYYIVLYGFYIEDIPYLITAYIWPATVKALFAVYIFKRVKDKKGEYLLSTALGIMTIGVIICGIINFHIEGFFNRYEWINGPEWMRIDYDLILFLGLHLFLMMIVGFIETILGNKKLMVTVLCFFFVNKLVLVFQKGIQFFELVFFNGNTLKEMEMLSNDWSSLVMRIMDVLFFAAMIIFLLKNDIPNMWLNGKKKRGKLSSEEEYGMLKADHKKGVIDNEKFEELKSELFLRV